MPGRRINFINQNRLKYGQYFYCQRGVCSLWVGRGRDRSRLHIHQQIHLQKREYGMFVVRALRGILKIRYILLGGAVGGGVTLQKVQFHIRVAFN